MKKLHILPAILLSLGMLTAGSLNAQTTLSISFNEDDNTPEGANGLASTDSAGVEAATNWNNINGELDSEGSGPFDLNDSTGTASGVEFTADGNWFDFAADDISGSGPNTTMFDWGANFDADGSPTPSISLTGLGASATYDVYLYLGLRGSQTSTNDDIITANSTSFTFDPDTLLSGFSGSFTQIDPGTSTAGNYVLFEGLTGDSLSITFDGGDSGASNPTILTGLQVSVIPEPSTAALLLGCAGFALLQRRRRRVLV